MSSYFELVLVTHGTDRNPPETRCDRSTGRFFDFFCRKVLPGTVHALLYLKRYSSAEKEAEKEIVGGTVDSQSIQQDVLNRVDLQYKNQTSED
jgi:hypothetical protein